ncbi:MAG: VanZ family protein [Chitinophagia bacterium]|nr:VanZ family protein [Chitinophagia bacterium]
MPSVFTVHSPYKRQARFVAALWTLLIFVGCFLPAKDIPDVNVPLADKWVHFVLFGGFCFFWLLAYPAQKLLTLLLWVAAGVATGIAVELLQGTLTFLGRSADAMDVLADSIGAVLGTILYAVAARASRTVG